MRSSLVRSRVEHQRVHSQLRRPTVPVCLRLGSTAMREVLPWRRDLRLAGRFLYRNQCSTLVIPPLTHGAGPILDTNGLYRLHHYLKARARVTTNGATCAMATPCFPASLPVQVALHTTGHTFPLPPRPFSIPPSLYPSLPPSLTSCAGRLPHPHSTGQRRLRSLPQPGAPCRHHYQPFPAASPPRASRSLSTCAAVTLRVTPSAKKQSGPGGPWRLLAALTGPAQARIRLLCARPARARISFISCSSWWQGPSCCCCCYCSWWQDRSPRGPSPEAQDTLGTRQVQRACSRDRLRALEVRGLDTACSSGGGVCMGRCGQNVATLEGGFSLVPDWVSGPYEAQVHPAPLRLRASLSRRTESDAPRHAITALST